MASTTLPAARKPRRNVEPARVIDIRTPEECLFDRLPGIRARIAEDLRAGTLEFPPLPVVAVELGKLAASPDPDMQDAMELVERDQELAGRVLRVASSPAMGARTVTDLRQAVGWLGVNGLRDLAFAASMGTVFRCGALDPLVREAMMHAFVVALASAKACRMLGVGQQYGFLCGLFHDIGRLGVLMALAKYGREDPERYPIEQAPVICNALHNEVGPLILSSWGVHSMVTRVAQHHHQPHRAAAAMPLCLAVATVDAADEIEADDAAQRFEALSDLPVGHQAGFTVGQLEELAEIVQTTRQDEVLAHLTGG